MSQNKIKKFANIDNPLQLDIKIFIQFEGSFNRGFQTLTVGISHIAEVTSLELPVIY